MKVLFIHQANIGSLSATGQLLGSLVEKLNSDISLVELSFKLSDINPNIKSFFDLNNLNPSQIIDLALKVFEAEKPDLIIFRPDDKLIFLTDFILGYCEVSNKRLIVSIMDSWFDTALPELAKLADQASGFWYISEPIKNYFNRLYDPSLNKKSYIISNGVDIENFSSVKLITKIKNNIKIGFLGAVNRHQTYEGLQLFSSAVHSQNKKCCFEIYTRQYDTELAKSLNKFNNVKLLPPVSTENYFKTLNSFDALVIPYGFSDEVIDYLQYSFGNKVPEFLATGLPILAIGDDRLNSMRYLSKIPSVKCVFSPNDYEAVLEWLDDMNNRYYEKWLSSFSNRVKALKYFDINEVSNCFEEMILDFK